MSFAVEVVGAEKRFANTVGLDALSLTVERGAVFGVLGPNGAGKTTTLRVLLGLLRLDKGSVRVLGLDPIVDGKRVREEVGVLLENDGLYDRLTAVANLEYYARIHRMGGATHERIEEVLRSFDLWERRRDAVATWSRGMRQKLAIARALLHRPKLLLLDEPFTGLDPGAAVELRERIATLAKENEVTVLMTTHDLAHVEKSCSDVAIMRAGRVVATGSPNGLGRSTDCDVLASGRGLTRSLLEGMATSGLIEAFSMTAEVADDDSGEARITCSQKLRARLGVELVERGVELMELRAVRGSLEEAFLSIVGSTAVLPSEAAERS